MLVAKGVGRRYGDVQAVEGLDLELAPGRIIGLVGNNGAGKTTTLKMLCGILEPTAGVVELDGQPTSRPATRQGIGYLPEDSPLYEDQTPLEYLAFFAALYGLSKKAAAQRAAQLLKRLRLDDPYWRKPIGELSKGSARKVAIARALLHDPKVLLLDEPASGLDPATRRELDDALVALRAEGKAILLSAHNLRQVEELCDGIVLMHAGRVVAQGSLVELRRQWGLVRYRVHATKPFQGSAPHGAIHRGELDSPQALEETLAALGQEGGVVLEVESLPPGLDEILARAAGV